MKQVVIENAEFVSLDDVHGTPEALLVEGGIIRMAGSRDECRAAARNASIIDLAGASVAPGFVDAHVHTGQFAREFTEVDLSAARSVDHALRLVQEAIARDSALGTDKWVLGGRWSQNDWQGRTMPTRWQLDSVTRGLPAAMHHHDLHTYWLNSRALELLGISRETPDPAGGTFVRDERGELTGILLERAAFDIQTRLEDHTAAGVQRHLPDALRFLLSRGITTIHDFDGLDAWNAFTALRDQSQLPLRVVKYFPVDRMGYCIEAGFRTGFGDDFLRIGGVKIFGDGSLNSRTSLMSEPYGDEHHHGLAVTPPEEMHDLVARAHDAELAVAIHAIGDRAVTHALQAIAASRARSEVAHLGDRIEHAQHVQPSDLDLIGRLAVAAAMQPTHCAVDTPMVEELLGHRHLISYGWKSLLSAGAAVAFSSDAPVEQPQPLLGLHDAITRSARADDQGWPPSERLSREEALRATCTNHSRLAASPRSGMLAPGWNADLVVLDRNPLAVDAREIADSEVLATFVAGETVWEKSVK